MTTRNSTNTDNIITYNTFDISQVQISDPKQNKHGGSVAQVSVGGAPLRLTFPPMRTPFGIGPGKNKEGQITKDEHGNMQFSLALALEETRENVPQFLKVMRELEDKMARTSSEKSIKWWGEETPYEIAKRLCNPIVKFAKDKETKQIKKEYAPNIQLKCSQKRVSGQGLFSPEFDFPLDVKNGRSKERVSLTIDNYTTLVPAQAIVTGIMECTGVWIANGKASMTFRVKYLLVKPSSSKISEEAIAAVIPDSDGEDDEPVATTTAAIANVPHHQELVEDSGREDSDDDGGYLQQTKTVQMEDSDHETDAQTAPSATASTPAKPSARGRKRKAEDEDAPAAKRR